MPIVASLSSLLAAAEWSYNTSGGAAGFICPCIMLVVGLGIFVLWIYALIDAIKNPSLDSNQRLIWILVIIFTSPIGPILYLLIGRKK